MPYIENKDRTCIDPMLKDVQVEHKLNICSIFSSIDGEANGFDGAGQLTTFIRLKGCNLSCSYCDTSYSQDFEPPNWMTVEEVIAKIQFPKVTITGGEPGLQKMGLRSLFSELVFRGYKLGARRSYQISVETNGTFNIEILGHPAIRAIVDYKLPSSGQEEKMNPEAFRYLRDIDVIKFVIADWTDYDRAKKVLEEQKEWQAKIVFSPAIAFELPCSCLHIDNRLVVGMDWPRLLVAKMLEDKINAQFSLQLHKILWPGAKEER